MPTEKSGISEQPNQAVSGEKEIKMRSVELYTGAGGLALGISRAGFEHLAVIELDRHSCDTIHENKKRKVEGMNQWPVFNSDVRHFDFGALPEGIELLAAGVPCQPFSIGASTRGTQMTVIYFPKQLM